MSIKDNIAAAIQDKNTNPTQLAKKIKMTQPTLHRILSGEIKDPGASKIKAIAKALNVEYSHLLDRYPNCKKEVNDIQAAYEYSDNINIPMLSAEGGQGHGISDQLEHDEIIKQIEVSKNYIKHNLPACTHPENLRIITGRGRSMQGLYNDGDMLWVDTGIKNIELDAVYVLWFEGELIIKNVQRKFKNGEKTYLLIPENKAYETVEVTNADNICILGLVLGALNFNKF